MFIGIATVTLGVAFDVFEFRVKRVLFARPWSNSGPSRAKHRSDTVPSVMLGVKSTPVLMRVAIRRQRCSAQFAVVTSEIKAGCEFWPTFPSKCGRSPSRAY